jgi:hypothetical protein
VAFWTQINIAPAWQEAARQMSGARGLGLSENALLFALLNMGVANTFIAGWGAKFTYNFWRPVTAIRNGDTDGNDATERDPGWTPANTTPMHPEYPLQATIISGVSVGVLEGFLGPRPALAVESPDLIDPEEEARLQVDRRSGVRARERAGLGRRPGERARDAASAHRRPRAGRWPLERAP